MRNGFSAPNICRASSSNRWQGDAQCSPSQRSRRTWSRQSRRWTLYSEVDIFSVRPSGQLLAASSIWLPVTSAVHRIVFRDPWCPAGHTSRARGRTSVLGHEGRASTDPRTAGCWCPWRLRDSWILRLPGCGRLEQDSPTPGAQGGAIQRRLEECCRGCILRLGGRYPDLHPYAVFTECFLLANKIQTARHKTVIITMHGCGHWLGQSFCFISFITQWFESFICTCKCLR